MLVSEPSLGADEKQALVDVIDSNWITMGSRVQAFERAFADMHRMADAVAVNSCTSGLHLVMAALGIGPGDEVLVPSLSFVATANCVVYCGARPVFVDIESLDVPLMSCADAAAKCTARTKAVIVMHYGGYLVDRDAWRDFADSRGLFLIEDSAHAVGTARASIFGDVAVFSFFGNKNMTTAEGGMIVAGDDGLLDRIRQLRAHGLTSSTVQRLRGQAVSYDVTMLGYNYRMDELSAAIGLVQLGKLDQWNKKRRMLAHLYRDLLEERCPDVLLPFPEERTTSHHIMPIVLPSAIDRQRVIGILRSDGIQTTIHYPPIHCLSWYRNNTPVVSLPLTEDFAARQLTLPLHPKMEAQHVDLVTQVLANAVTTELAG
ncbi:DegT/DnrJ/EryC1/StrS aminotransferase family protein [Rhodovastum sp. RN2-1]|uniref:DegT/DnrJ/EryC1/StrS aminotransferase family protein n=1 Tax=Limobrevibacterium gyesilva TaxID=2991712 RepID=A0AA41YJD8_9PROT|nr:DegT/DnrJ/EryC1/StrS aminotransferase family protein [Limobrevibacterium gyesilva]MCW3474794.1 DegT/DnrJ/EryC1/StrS aminotransferase family protein [Limobrevibacterium gyesilva]